MRERVIEGGTPVSVTDRIELTSVTYEVGGKRLIDIDRLAIEGAGVTVIMGPNGAGKSLLLRLMHGLIAPTGGSVKVNGAPLGQDHRRAQALVFQKPVLLRRTAAANIDFVLKARGRSIAERDELLLELLSQTAAPD